MTKKKQGKISAEKDSLESLTQSMGWKIFSEIKEESASFWESVWWEKQIMKWCMADDEVKLETLRYIDAFPSLKSDKEVVNLLKEYFPQSRQKLPLALKIGEQLIGPATLTPGATASAIRYSIRKMALNFISGANVDEAVKVLRDFREEGYQFTMDLLGEAVTSEKEADFYAQGYISMLQAMNENLDVDKKEEINVSLKLSSLYSQFDPIHPEKTTEKVSDRLLKILRVAAEHGNFVNIDIEQYAYRDTAMEIFKKVIERDEFRASCHFGIVIQAYLKDSRECLINLLNWMKEKQRDITVRLVKGAYWDYEIINARQKGWPIPVYTSKSETDANFEELAGILLENHATVRTAFGTHNIRSIARGLALSSHLDVPEDRFEIQMLYGMGDLIQKALAQIGYSVRVYTPYGELIPGMAYLVRRILENTSNDSFLRQGFEEHVPKEKLLAPPEVKKEKTPGAYQAKKNLFANCPLNDFSQFMTRETMKSALSEARRKLGGKYPVLIGGKKCGTDKEISSVNPSNLQEMVGHTGQANQELVDMAVQTAVDSFKTWGKTTPQHRANILFECANIMRTKRFDLAAWMILETGKNWREADADVVEAIDFLNYYAHEILKIGEFKKTENIPGEDNFYGYRPRGVGLIISPWNFPLAILTGMAAAAVAAGNTVIIKPSNNSPVIAYKLMEIFHSAGVPGGVINYLPGSGAEIGDYLVQKKEIDFITFTGSREVGLRIRKLASENMEGGAGIKNVVAEMGGKNPMIIDGSADLDEAVKDAIASAFGYGGQKCSAASRIIVMEQVYEIFLNRFLEGVKSIEIGPTEDPSSFYGPLIDAAAVEKVKKFTEIGKKEANLVLETDVGDLAEQGYFIGPRVFTDVDPDSLIAQEEIFGPVVCVLKAKDIREAVTIANNTRYGLTAGIFSRSPGNIEYAKTELKAGNIYVNRGITGAIVGRQPFGGFKMSGIGSKAGGPDYIKQFLYPVTLSENTTRHGFAPLDTEKT